METRELCEILTQSNYIKMLCANEDVTLTELAEKLNKSQANFSKQMKRSNFRVSDMEKIADALGYEFTYEFKRK